MTECSRMKELLAASCMAALLLDPRCGEPDVTRHVVPVATRNAVSPNGTSAEQWAATRRDMCEAGSWTCDADGTSRIIQTPAQP